MKHETTQTQTLGGGQRVWVALPGRQGRHLKEVALQQQEVWSKLGILQARTFRGQGCRGSQGCFPGGKEVPVAGGRGYSHREEASEVSVRPCRASKGLLPHFIEGDTEAQRGKIACPRSHH